ncbi:MAG: protein kinase [Deltaproteobacteria bacterium]|nr:protein kinase [Deltaproteobacteria bacterium]
MGRHELLAELGRGGMASVYLARGFGSAGFERLAAVKLLHRNLCADQDFVEMFLDEARVAARLHHPNATAIIDVGAEGPQLYMVMDYVEGDTLHAVQCAATALRRAVPLGIALRVVLDALAGLDAAHELRGPDGESLGLIHRDATPHNILIGVDGAARLVDFGIARAAGRIGVTSVGVLKGKLPFMAPEQIRGRAVDRRADVFSMGVTLWETIALRRCFPSREGSAALSPRRRGLPPAARGGPAGARGARRHLPTRARLRSQRALRHRVSLRRGDRGRLPRRPRDPAGARAVHVRRRRRQARRRARGGPALVPPDALPTDARVEDADARAGDRPPPAAGAHLRPSRRATSPVAARRRPHGRGGHHPHRAPDAPASGDREGASAAHPPPSPPEGAALHRPPQGGRRGLGAPGPPHPGLPPPALEAVDRAAPARRAEVRSAVADAAPGGRRASLGGAPRRARGPGLRGRGVPRGAGGAGAPEDHHGAPAPRSAHAASESGELVPRAAATALVSLVAPMSPARGRGGLCVPDRSPCAASTSLATVAG